MKARRDEQGFALLVVLWFVTALATLAVAFTASSRLEVRRVANLADAAQARALLDAGIALAIAGLHDPEPARRTPLDGRARERTVAGARVAYRVFDESGRLNLNRAPPDRLARLFEAAGAGPGDAADLTAAVLAARGDARREAGRPFLSVEELAHLPGLEPDLHRRVAPALSVDADGERLNGPTAPALALAAMPNLSPQDREAVLDLRRNPSRPTDPGLAARLAAAGIDWSAIDWAGKPPPVRRLTVRVRVETPAGAVASAEAVLFALDPPAAVPYRIVEWREPADF
ncbi:hypothetical protein [Azospirillum sp.]|uniref:general secretion pathway protein GspK n=1 Tax=Azospirillum sp. TaxID=34012 RepID=UPI002D6FF9D6|nr:hypothetical protein [Azospirillum sp.]HYD69051.1 hypothetical protein [Azospirillum sp.]